MGFSLRALMVNVPGLRAVMRRSASQDSADASKPSGRPDPGRRMMERIEAQRRIERHISEQLDLEQLLVITVESALRLIGGMASVVYLRDGDLLSPRAWTVGAEWVRDVPVPIGSGVLGRSLAIGEGLMVNDYGSSPLALADFRAETARLLAQPLQAGGRVLGGMVISRDAAQ